MEIIKQSTNVDKRMAYKLSKQTNKMSDLVGSPVKLEAWLLYTDVDSKTNETKEVVSVMVEGRSYATISNTFIKEFKDIIDVFGDDDLEIIVNEGISKNGRKYIYPTLA